MKQVTGLPERRETELDRLSWTQIITQWEAGPQRGHPRKRRFGLERSFVHQQLDGAQAEGQLGGTRVPCQALGGPELWAVTHLGGDRC